jgi:hypothetical protein
MEMNGIGGPGNVLNSIKQQSTSFFIEDLFDQGKSSLLGNGEFKDTKYRFGGYVAKLNGFFSVQGDS